MATSAEELYRKALSLDESDRAALAARLIESLDTETEEGVEAAWFAEVERRMEEFDSGKVQGIPWDELRTRLLGKLDASDKG